MTPASRGTREMLRRTMRRLVLPAAMCSAATAAAQSSGSLSVVSEYRYRGVPLSEGRPVPQLHLGYDDKSGWYAGAFASGIRLYNKESTDAQMIGYAGYAQRRPSGTRWELGATQSVIAGAPSYNYAEAFAGLGFGNISGRLYFSPEYFGRHVRTLYAEINGTYPLHRRMELFAHIGFLHTLSATEQPAIYSTNRRDISLGANAALGNWNVGLAWIAATRRDNDRVFYENGNHAWTLTVSYPF